ncbi:MAG TPA: glycosyltransferase [Thermoanaerobaculia bacterium]|nr:glycosyltransferase [Thermoanaerobaculia bacterium]
MNILHLAAANRWTGAAAPAFAEVEALRAAGLEAHYAYVGGYKLEAKLAGCSFAHPILDRAQNPVSFLRSARAIRRLIREHGIGLVHAHLTWDHWLARFAARRLPVRVARTFHSRRALRLDPLTSSLIRSTNALFIVNETLRESRALRGRAVMFTPPPLDQRLFTPAGPDVRARYGIDTAAKVIAAIGKIATGRGFEDVLRTFALVRRDHAGLRLMIIGDGPHRGALEKLAGQLGLGTSVLWAGYHEDDLPEHYRAADLLLFTASGSDEGHRAVIEALGCGLPPAVFPIAGVQVLLGPLAPRLVAASSTPEALAAVVAGLLRSPRGELADAAAEQGRMFIYARAAERLRAGYDA